MIPRPIVAQNLVAMRGYAFVTLFDPSTERNSSPVLLARWNSQLSQSLVEPSETKQAGLERVFIIFQFFVEMSSLLKALIFAVDGVTISSAFVPESEA